MSQAVTASLSWLHLANFQYSTINGAASKLGIRHTYSSSFGWTRKKRDQAINASSRHLANFESTVWGFQFLSHTCQEITDKDKLEVEELKEIVKKLLVVTPDNTTQKLALIDTIQRLGLAYHFESEIKASIQNIFGASQHIESAHNLHDVALLFRLARQQGHCMSSDVFKKFTEHDGKFKETLANDVEGLLSLYEAAHLRVHEEEILEEALIFTTTHLESKVPNLRSSLKVQVTEALRQPIHRTVPRVGARKYISIYENIEACNDLLLKFAKLDFNLLQKLHQKELREVTSWWKDLDSVNKWPYAKDRMVEGYFWTVALYFEPQCSSVRKILAKVIAICSIIDDTYDAYGTFDELVLFTDAIQGWDISTMDSLPPYMRTMFQALLDIYNEMEQMIKEGKSYSIYHAKNEVKKLARAHLKEAEWLNNDYIPKSEEYMKNALVTSAAMLLITHSLVGIEEPVTKETFEWVTNGPQIVQAAQTLSRLMDDIADHEVEQKRGHVASFVECYMKEYGASKEEAYVQIQKEVTNAWKNINKEILGPMKISIFVLQRVLNFVRMVDTFFKDGQDGYTDPTSKITDLITLLFVESVKI